MLLAAIDIGIANATRRHQARKGRLDRHGGIIRRQQHIFRRHTLKPRKQRFGDYAGSAHLLIQRSVIEDDINGQVERPGILAFADSRQITDASHLLL